MTSLQNIIEGVLGKPCRLKVKRIATEYTRLAMPTPVVRTEKKRKPLKKRLMIATLGGLMCCDVPEFDPTTYKGLKQNCGRVSKHEKEKQKA